MEVIFNNLMETLVAEKLDMVINTMDCCKCEQCRADIISFALNRLPTKYVSTRMGEVYSKMYSLSVQHEADILGALAVAVRVVVENPRHVK